MKVVVCLSGLDTAEFVQRVLEKLPQVLDITLLTIIDTRPAEELTYVRRARLFGIKAVAPSRSMELQEASRQIATDILSEARTVIEQSQYRYRLLEQVVLEGRPEIEIVQFMQARSADLLVLGTRQRNRLTNQAADYLPMGPVARYIVDHVMCDLLLLK